MRACGDGLEDLVADQVAVGVVDRLEVVDVDQRQRERRLCSPCPGQLDLGFRLPGGHVEQAGLGIDARLGNEQREDKEPADEQHGRHRDEYQGGAEAHGERDQHPEVDFDEQRLHRLAVQVEPQDPHAGVGQLHRADDQEVVRPVAENLAGGDRQAPGEGVGAGPTLAPANEAGIEWNTHDAAA